MALLAILAADKEGFSIHRHIELSHLGVPQGGANFTDRLAKRL